MTAAAFGSPFFAIATLLLSIALGSIATGIAWSYERRSRRLPEATRYEGLIEKNAAMDADLIGKSEELRRLQAQIDTRDRLAAEAAALGEQISTLKVELAGLDGARQEIEQVQRDAVEAVARLVEVRAQLDQAAKDVAAAVAERDDARREVDRLREEAVRMEDELRRRRDRMPEEIAALERDKESLLDEISRLRPNRDALLAAEQQTQALAARAASLRVEVENTEQELREAKLRASELEAERERLATDAATLRTEVTGLRGAREELQVQQDELARGIDGLYREQDRLQSAVHANKADAERFAEQRNLLVDAVAELRAEQAVLATLRDDVGALEARKATLEAALETLSSGKRPGESEQVMRELAEVPKCITIMPTRPHGAEEEETALHHVQRTLTDQGLEFHPRAIYALHTALKINEVAQMAVLAGVSGTGKSLLPRRYAEAMGIGFLQIAVEPRWDSPQDLLGFYNYIEQRYRATDLARILVQMDPYNTSRLRAGTSEGDDRMMLVLLDEMNLARVEYYFSEFLGRLGIRPQLGEAGEEARRQAAALAVDIPGRGEGPIRLFPSHNVLFVGTMNDDESTQALSDKVLDRGNVLQFAAPARFARPTSAPAVPPAATYRPFSQWQKWVRPISRLADAERHRVEGVIKSLSAIMDSVGRPFGHRLNEAMLAYVANYPRGKGVSVGVPIADQIEMRILPKLRGVPLEDFQAPFQQLSELIRSDAEDSLLADRLDTLVAAQRQGVGQFSWRGLDRG